MNIPSSTELLHKFHTLHHRELELKKLSPYAQELTDLRSLRADIWIAFCTKREQERENLSDDELLAIFDDQELI